MTKRREELKIPMSIVLDAADSRHFDAPPFGMLTSFAVAYWRKPIDISDLSRERLAFLCRTSVGALRRYESDLRAMIPTLARDLDQARQFSSRKAAGIQRLLEVARAAARAKRLAAKDARAAAPVAAPPRQHWGARLAAIDRRASGAGGFVD